MSPAVRSCGIQHDFTNEHWDLVRKNGGGQIKIFGILTTGLEH
jgi:hypothetical protein